MQKHYNYLTVDLDKRIYNKLKAVQGDSKSRYILANLISNNIPYDLSDCTVKYYAVKKDKTKIFNDAIIINAKQGQFEIELTNQALAVAGDLELQILILGSNQERLTSFSFFVEVGKTIISDEAIESTNEFNALVGAFNKLEEWNGYFEETSGQIEEKYTDRLNNLDNRVEKIETLKIQDEVEMSTENGYIVCKNTNNGQITGVKIEGNTLVNVISNPEQKIYNDNPKSKAIYKNVTELKLDTTYTIHCKVSITGTNLNGQIVRLLFEDGAWTELIADSTNLENFQGTYTKTFSISKPLQKTNPLQIAWARASSADGCAITVEDLMIIEGDYTQKIPSFFKGLQSVGEGVNQLEVLSRLENGNLFNSVAGTPAHIINGTAGYNGYHDIRLLSDNLYFYCSSSGERISNGNIAFRFKDANNEIIGRHLSTSTSDGESSFVSLKSRDVDYRNVRSVELFWNNVAPTCTIDYIYMSHVPMKLSTGYEIDKKTVLFKNENGNYEKVILRSLPNGVEDTIEKHSNGKYYYHKRCEQLLLSGGEGWVLNNGTSANKDTSLKFETTKFANLVSPINDASISNHIISDKFKSSSDTSNHSDAEECITQTVSPFNSISIRIEKTKLSTQDASGFDKWLQSNNVTVVVALAKEEVYECINIDLDCFEGETSIICNSNITPSNMSFKIASHISNTVEIMKDRMGDVEDKLIELLNGDMTQTLGQNGYKILPGGLILQWGQFYVDFASEKYKGYTVNFPIEFPNDIMYQSANMFTGDTRSYKYLVNMTYNSLKASGAKITYLEGNSSTDRVHICWCAIGY